MIRRIVPGETGPTGGPAFADVLGTCRSWGDGVAVVEPASGEAVSVPIELIVSGKPVPPRPSVRGRVSARDAELHTAALERGVETTPLGEWQLRFEPAPVGRVRSRFNSCLAMGDPRMPVIDAITQVAGFYESRGRRPELQVEVDSEVETVVSDLGWTPVTAKDSLHLLASLAQVRRRLPAPSEALPVTADGPYLVVASPDARGAAGLDGDWLGLHGLFVAEHARRRGLARAVIAALLEAGAEQGARTVWLHVETSNAPAIALYESLGFAEHHRCRYYTAPAD